MEYLSEDEAEELSRNVLALTHTIINNMESICTGEYPTDGRLQMLFAYMTILSVKHSMDKTIDQLVENPLQFRMACLDAVVGGLDD